MSSLSTKQKLSVVALVIAGVVFLGALARFTDANNGPPPTASEIVAATRDCIRDAKTDAEIDACNDPDVSEPWYERQPVLASLLAGGVTFFVIAGGGRLLMK